MTAYYLPTRFGCFMLSIYRIFGESFGGWEGEKEEVLQPDEKATYSQVV